MKTWRVKKGHDFRVNGGHPWVFSNELAESPKGVTPGELVRLESERGQFLGVGTGHPQSLISFRLLSRRERSVLDAQFFYELFGRAHRWRVQNGWDLFSHRLIHGEGDGVSGLVIDRFKNAVTQVFVVQPSTAGTEAHIEAILTALRDFARKRADESGLRETVILINRTSSGRALDGLPFGPVEIVEGALTGLFRAELPAREGVRHMLIDLLGGQKTGFFLDQGDNIRRTLQFLHTYFKDEPRHFRVLDLCSYVGQWSHAIKEHFLSNGQTVELDVVDVSREALQLAEKNLEGTGAHFHQLDVLKDLSALPNGSFDVVICDPPAFIKKRADLNKGIPAYTKLNRDAARKVSSGGIFVTCSCSGLLKSEDFEKAVRDGLRKAEVSGRFAFRGGHAPDHPVELQFPEGEYLKAVAFSLSPLQSN